MGGASRTVARLRSRAHGGCFYMNSLLLELLVCLEVTRHDTAPRTLWFCTVLRVEQPRDGARSYSVTFHHRRMHTHELSIGIAPHTPTVFMLRTTYKFHSKS